MDWIFIFVAGALMTLGGALVFRGRRRGANRPLNSLEANPVPASPEPPADGAAEVLEYLHRLEAQGSPGLAADVIEVFLQDTASRVTALRRAIDQGDGETVFRVAHTLQGSASMIGAASVARSCNALAKSARTGSFDQCRVLVAELNARFEAIQRAMPVRRLTGPEQLR
jgi:two-component system, sensor histidine kinase and response regulator